MSNEVLTGGIHGIPQKCDCVPCLRAQRDALLAAARDFAEHGLRVDLNPTKMIPASDTPGWTAEEAKNNERWWHAYLRMADVLVRERARSAIAQASGGEEKT